MYYVVHVAGIVCVVQQGRSFALGPAGATLLLAGATLLPAGATFLPAGVTLLPAGAASPLAGATLLPLGDPSARMAESFSH